MMSLQKDNSGKADWVKEFYINSYPENREIDPEEGPEIKLNKLRIIWLLKI